MRQISLACVFLIAVSLSTLTCESQELVSTSPENLWARKTLQEATTLVRNLPEDSQDLMLPKIAAELQRLNLDDDAKALWLELDTVVKESVDDERRWSLLTAMARERMRVGDAEGSKATVNKIEDSTSRHRAIQQVARVLCEQDKFGKAVAYAEEIPRSDGNVLFDAMEEIALAAAKGGDVTSAFRASRGMNPGQGGSLERKLRAVSKMCASFWKAGHKKAATSFIRQGKGLNDVMKSDLETTMKVDTTLAALVAEDFEAEFKKLLARLEAGKEEQVKKDVVKVAMAGVALDFERSDLLKHIRSDIKEAQWACAVLAVENVVEHGDAEAVEKLQEHWNPLLPKNPLVIARAWNRLSASCIKSDKHDAALAYNEKVEPILRSFLQKESRPKSFPSIVADYAANESTIGRHVKALALVRQLPEKESTPDLMTEIVAAMTLSQ